MSKVYDLVRDRIVTALESGVSPWSKPWIGGAPANLKSGRSYSGINVFLCGCNTFRSRYFLTYKQAAELGGQVKRGEKATPIVFYSPLPGRVERTPSGEVSLGRDGCVMRYYSAFNLDQIDGIEDPDLAEGLSTVAPDPIHEIESLVESMPNRCAIEWIGQRAYYSPLTDTVTMPDRERFSDSVRMYAVLLHELAHSTGHRSRLARFKTGDASKGTAYAAEELVAEVASCLTLASLGIDPPIDEASSYCAGWAQRIRGMNSAQAVCRAMSAASRAADYMLGRLPVAASEPTEAETAVA